MILMNYHLKIICMKLQQVKVLQDPWNLIFMLKQAQQKCMALWKL